MAYRQAALLLGLAAFHNQKTHALRIFYADSGSFERKTPENPGHFAKILNDQETTRFVPVRNGDSFFAESSMRATYLSAADLGPQLLSATAAATAPTDPASLNTTLFVYLGSRSNVDYVAVDLTDEILQPLPLQQKGVNQAMLRNFSENMVDEEEAALLAYARGMCVWHRNTHYCAKCGSRTRPQRYGSSRKCVSDTCKASSYPRIEPASIQLVTDRSQSFALLGRKKEWPQGRFSCLAGFTEVGETLEQTVLRETFEESGVAVDPSTVRFVASQPWPFPHSLMIGYRAECASTGLPVIEFDKKEMDDVRWFGKEAVREALLRTG
jgi:NADH pyrophosphatase NudC (nudix superfamily)